MTSSTSRLGQVPGAKVITYYADADGQYSSTKIGYDVDLFDQSVRNIVFGEIRKNQDLIQENDDEDVKVSKLNINNSDTIKPIEEPILISKESIKFICEHLEVNAKLAEKALKSSEGSLKKALLYLINEANIH